MKQERYIVGVEQAASAASQEDLFTSLRGRLSWWPSSTRTDLSYYTAKLGQVRPDECGKREINLLRKAIIILKEKNIQLTYPKLDHKTESFMVYKDAGFATNADMTSQLGFIVLMTDESKRCAILHWNS